MKAVDRKARGVMRVPKLDFSAEILGARWRILADHRLPRDTDGDCNAGLKRIRIHPSNPPEKLAEVLFHECTHAAFDHLDEQYVDPFGGDLAAILFRPDVLAFLGLQRIPHTQRAS